MESAALALNGYSQATRQIRSPRNIEYDVFAQITARLRAANGRPEDFPALIVALDSNRELWTLLAIDVADPGNSLPRDLKAKIFYLAEFTLQHTGKVLGGTASADVLIGVNTAVMAGLRSGRVAS